MKKLLVFWMKLKINLRQGVAQTLMASLDYIYRKIVKKSRIQFLVEKSSNASNRTDELSTVFISTSRRLIQSGVYRAINQRDQLVLNSIRSDIKSLSDVDILNSVGDYNFFIFQRPFLSEIVERLLYKIRQSGKIAIYDIDDLVSSLDLAKQADVIHRDLFLENVKSHRKTMERFDYFITSNELIANELKKDGKKAFVNRNCLGLEQIRMSERAFHKRKMKPGKVRLGYFGGLGYQDFLHITQPLLYVMSKYDQVELYIGKFISLGPEFEPYRHRIKRFSYVKLRKLPSRIATTDINLAPVEDNPFSQAKSAVKYMEAGILGIPTIASPTECFKFAIKHGENGMLASKPEDWVQCLQLLITDESARRRIGENAREHVKMYYSPSYRGKELINTLQHIMEEISL